MAVQRRLGSETARNRAVLIDATEQVLCEEGYAAVTARRVAEQAKLKLPLVYYYFQSMDDLVLAVVRKNVAKRLERFKDIPDGPDPMKALWDLNTDSSGTIMTELMALANHRASIRDEIVASAKQYRALQAEVFRTVLTARGIDLESYPAVGVTVIVAALARVMMQDTVLGASDGYDEALGILERGLEFLKNNVDVTQTADA